MGQRLVELERSYTGFVNNTAVLHVNQLPPNAAILAPGPALLFVVVNGVPSVGVHVMVGNGKVGAQDMGSFDNLPASSILTSSTTTDGNGDSADNTNTDDATHPQPIFLLICIYALLPLLLRW